MNSPVSSLSGRLVGHRIEFQGRLAGMTRSEAARLVRDQGGEVVRRGGLPATLVVTGEFRTATVGPSDVPSAGSPTRASDWTAPEVMAESDFWQRLGLVEGQEHVRKLVTPAMLADLLGVPVATIRRWHRRGLIVPAREVHRLPYFDFQEVAAARRLAEMVAAGMSQEAIEAQVRQLADLAPGVDRPLAQLAVLLDGKHVLLREGEGLIDASGQLRFDFDPPPAFRPAIPQESAHLAEGAYTPAELTAFAAEADDAGDREQALATYRAALAAGGPTPQLCFQLGELLYRKGDLSAARERFYMAVELDDEFVEARCNLGCLLAEMGELELAAAAFEGALSLHHDYPDAHYHLAQTLDELGRPGDARTHWLRFLDLAPDSPWAEEAEHRVGLS
jgi:tetratricopeptide (TPR) repeat protein